MKRIFGALFALMLVFSVAGNAVAALDPGDLVLVAYNATANKEVAFDLGTTSNFVGGDAFDLAALGGSANVGVFSNALVSGHIHAYFVTTTPNAPTLKTSSLGGFYSGANATMTNHNALAGAVGTTSANTSYWNKMNSGATPGQYAGYNGDFALGEGFFDSVNDVVQFYLWGYDNSSPINGPGYEMTFLVRGDGTVSAVPIPASVLLFGSSLLGVFGIRRKRG